MPDVTIAGGKPASNVFRVTREGTAGRNRGVTQFGRALTELNIDIICANTPQAKGRVERMNRSLQDRLVKELRLRGVSSTWKPGTPSPRRSAKITTGVLLARLAIPMTPIARYNLTRISSRSSRGGSGARCRATW